jgi:hypothetical protein
MDDFGNIIYALTVPDISSGKAIWLANKDFPLESKTSNWI